MVERKGLILTLGSGKIYPPWLIPPTILAHRC